MRPGALVLLLSVGACGGTVEVPEVPRATVEPPPYDAAALASAAKVQRANEAVAEADEAAHARQAASRTGPGLDARTRAELQRAAETLGDGATAGGPIPHDLPIRLPGGGAGWQVMLTDRVAGLNTTGLRVPPGADDPTDHLRRELGRLGCTDPQPMRDVASRGWTCVGTATGYDLLAVLVGEGDAEHGAVVTVSWSP